MLVWEIFSHFRKILSYDGKTSQYAIDSFDKLVKQTNISVVLLDKLSTKGKTFFLFTMPIK
jgi:hypothetical protein